MASLAILTWPNPVLQLKSTAVTSFDAALAELVSGMFGAMYQASGRGLAAAQVGVLARVFVMDATWKVGEPGPQVFVNPEIVEHGTERLRGPESCLSLPGVSIDVERSVSLRMGWLDAAGMPKSGWLHGFAAICAQHECDHLDGILTLDHLSPSERDAALARHRSG